MCNWSIANHNAEKQKGRKIDHDYLNDFGLDKSDILLENPKLCLFVLMSNVNNLRTSESN